MFRTKRGAAALSIASNALLTAFKLSVGLAAGLVSVVSEAIHSAIDLLAAVMTFFSVRYSDRPADSSHPYGHGKMENVTGTIEGVLILIAAVWILIEAAGKLLHPSAPESYLLPLVVMAFSAGANMAVSRLLFRVAKETDSVAVEADAHHLSVDVYTSAGVAAGLALQWATGWEWVDPIVAIAIAAVILWIGWRVTRKAFSPLMDSSLPPEDVEKVKAAINAGPRGLFTFHKLRTRKAGGRAMIDVHLQFAGSTGLEEAHRESHRTGDRIRAAIPGAQVLVHIEPGRENDGLPRDHPWVAAIRAAILQDARVLDVPRLIVRDIAGSPRADVVVAVDPGINMADGDVLLEAIRERVSKALPGTRIAHLRMFASDIPSAGPDAVPTEIAERLTGITAGFPGLHSLHIHRTKGGYDVDCHLYCPKRMPFEEVHRLADMLEETIRDELGETVEVNVHAEPCAMPTDTCSDDCGPCGREAAADGIPREGRPPDPVQDAP
ncbi:MAG: cation-efflux pump [Planctomycetota bacterium]|nr:cation-efflux pump [Planctomycetota bacterium]